MVKIKRKKFKFVAEWCPEEGGKVRARIETPTGNTPWIKHECRDIRSAEAVADRLFNILKKNL